MRSTWPKKEWDIIAVDLCDQIDSVPYGMSTPTTRGDGSTGRGARPTDLVQQADVRTWAADGGREAGLLEIGPVDIVVANAGIFSHAPTREMSAESGRT